MCNNKNCCHQSHKLTEALNATKHKGVDAKWIIQTISDHLTLSPKHKITITLKDEVMDIICSCRGYFVK